MKRTLSLLIETVRITMFSVYWSLSDCQLLVDQSLARLKLFEAQLELSFLSQERR